MNWHMPGSEQLMMMSTVKVPPDVSILHQDWQGYYVQDPLYQEFWQELEPDGVARDGDSSSFFILYKGRERYNTKICVPQGILEKVIKGIHTYAHPGIDKTVQLFNRKFVVPDPEFTQSKLKETVSKVVGHCRVCQTQNTARVSNRIPLIITPSLTTYLTASRWISWTSQGIRTRKGK